MADATALFNVAQRLGGSIGISVLATFFQVREQVHVSVVMRQLGLPTNALDSANTSISASGLGSLPGPTRDALAQAATNGFHEVIGLLVVLALFGTGVALLLDNGRMSQLSRFVRVTGHIAPTANPAAARG